MCSIAGNSDISHVKAMLSLMKHRSPDEEGVFYDDKFCMGMGRLAIIDLESKGLCPYIEGNTALIFNGEIYNYKELRRELIKKDYDFRTVSDTEVLFKAYKEWGIECLDKLNGMFAFAIYDGENIFLARDIAGEKPLYYEENPFRFSSEAKALQWKCKEFPPASYGIYNVKNKKLIIKKWWEFKPKDLDKNYIKELEWLLEDSVKLRTQADVKYALYYSGGIDSSLINTFHNFDYKLTYEDKDYEKEFKKKIKQIVYHLDYPVNSFSAFGLWKLAEMAKRKGIKVVLSGEGADELFGGYVRYMPDALYEQAQQKFPSYTAMFPVKKKLEEWCIQEFNGNLRELLRMGDRMSSAFGIENRCPYLDRRIIEFAFSLPFNMKINGFETKYILRRILQKRNPQYKDIEKQGLFCSVNQWIGVKDKYDKKEYLKLQNKTWKSYQ